MADALRRLGWHRAADGILTCGQTCYVRRCDSCDEDNAASRILVHCGLRVCPMCARRLSQRRMQRLEPAFKRVPGYVRARRKAVLDDLEVQAGGAAAAVDHWLRLAGAARDEVKRERLNELARCAADRLRAVKWTMGRVKDEAWGYKILTISPRWNPADPKELSIDGLRARIKALWKLWAKVWDGDKENAGLRCGGLASAAVSIELSSGGHVHLHALVFAPFVTKQWLARRAGCFIDVRQVRDLKSGLREACKYVTKLPSPTRAEWLAGKKFRVLHEDLAARWVVATSRQQLARVYGGPLRDALAADAAMPDDHAPTPDPGAACRRCGKDLSNVSSVLVPTAEMARSLGQDFWRCVHLVRGP